MAPPPSGIAFNKAPPLRRDPAARGLPGCSHHHCGADRKDVSPLMGEGVSVFLLAADWSTGETKWPSEKKGSSVRGLLSH